MQATLAEPLKASSLYWRRGDNARSQLEADRARWRPTSSQTKLRRENVEEARGRVDVRACIKLVND